MTNIDPHFWGDGLWKFMYSVAFSLPEDNISNEVTQAVKTNFESLKFIIPCENCRDNYIKDIEANPIPDTITKTTLENWVNQIHNATNTRLHKPHVNLHNMLALSLNPKPLPNTNIRTTTNTRNIKNARYTNNSVSVYSFLCTSSDRSKNIINKQ